MLKVKFKKEFRFAADGTNVETFGPGFEEVSPRCAQFALDCEVVSNKKDVETALAAIEKAEA